MTSAMRRGQGTTRCVLLPCWLQPGSLGPTHDCMCFEFGDRDAFSIVDLPDDEAAAAVALIANASGGATVKTTVLLTPEQVDEAANRAVTYRPPGL